MAISRLKRLVRALLWKDALECELDEELNYHLGRLIEQNISDGMKPEDARSAAHSTRREPPSHHPPATNRKSLARPYSRSARPSSGMGGRAGFARHRARNYSASSAGRYRRARACLYNHSDDFD